MQLPADRHTHASDEPRTPDQLEFGSFAPAVTDASRRSLVVATYNIRYAVGSFLITGSLLRRIGLTRPARRARLVGDNIRRSSELFSRGRRMPPVDLVALQEADRRTTRAGGRHVSRELAERLGMSFVYAWADAPGEEPPKAKQWYLDFEERVGVDNTGDTGVATLSRLPLSDARRIELPWNDCPWRPRLALAASVRLDQETRLHLVNVHIDPHGSIEERLEQQRAVIAEADRLYGHEPTVIAGDFNTLTREARDGTLGLLREHGFSTPMPSGVSTWRAGLLRLHTDWIFVRGARVLRWGVARRPGLSDHWPVWAEVGRE